MDHVKLSQTQACAARRKLIISMQGGEKLSLEQIQAFLDASQEARFEGQSKTEVYGWVTRTLQQHGYNGRKRFGKVYCGATSPN
ncbi:MAG: hypothetical protein ACR2NN_23050 [Bryobacteraceae bacterium]